MSFTENDLDHVIRLAHLQVDDSKKNAYLPQIRRILGYMAQLDQLDLTNVQPSSHAHDVETVLRDDVVVPQGDLLLETNAPLWTDHAFEVPKIVSE